MSPVRLLLRDQGLESAARPECWVRSLTTGVRKSAWGLPMLVNALEPTEPSDHDGFTTCECRSKLGHEGRHDDLDGLFGK